MIRYLKRKVRLLEEFGIPVSPTMYDKLAAMYPNTIAIENYTHDLIMNHLQNIIDRELRSRLEVKVITFLIVED